MYIRTSVVIFITVIWSCQLDLRPSRNSSPSSRLSFAVVPDTAPSAILIRLLVISFWIAVITASPNQASSNLLTSS
jgi:hypothetical protein